MADFNVSSREDGEVSVIKVKGYLDAHTAPDLENEFNKLIEKKSRALKLIKLKQLVISKYTQEVYHIIMVV